MKRIIIIIVIGVGVAFGFRFFILATKIINPIVTEATSNQILLDILADRGGEPTKKRVVLGNDFISLEFGTFKDNSLYIFKSEDKDMAIKFGFLDHCAYSPCYPTDFPVYLATRGVQTLNTVDLPLPNRPIINSFKMQYNYSWHITLNEINLFIFNLPKNVFDQVQGKLNSQ